MPNLPNGDTTGRQSADNRGSVTDQIYVTRRRSNTQPPSSDKRSDDLTPRQKLDRNLGSHLSNLKSPRVKASLLILVAILEMHPDVCEGELIDKLDGLRTRIVSGQVGLERMRDALVTERVLPGEAGDLRRFASHATRGFEVHLGPHRKIQDARDDFLRTMSARSPNTKQALNGLFTIWDHAYPSRSSRRRRSRR